MAVEGLPSDRNRLALFVYVGFRFYIPSGSVREAEVSYGYKIVFMVALVLECIHEFLA